MTQDSREQRDYQAAENNEPKSSEDRLTSDHFKCIWTKSTIKRQKVAEWIKKKKRRAAYL